MPPSLSFDTAPPRLDRRARPTIRSLSFAALVAAAISSPAFVLANGGFSDGAVFALTNATSGNQVVVYNRDNDGRLSGRRTFATGGNGSGGGLGNQGAIALSDSGQWLLAVNPGSDSVSVFLSVGNHLLRTDVESSGGVRPVSVTIEDDIVYVLNAGSDDVQGFRLSIYGRLTPISGSRRALSASGTAPAQVEFNRDGDLLAVTEKATNKILTFAVDGDGRLGPATTTDSPSPTPFGFAFGRRDTLLVSEAVGGAAGASTLSSYRLSGNAGVTTVSAAVPSGQSAACWVVTTRDGRFAYVSNTASGNLSAYRISSGGAATLDAAIAADTGTGSGPTDMALDRNSRFLYSLNPRNSTISAFRVQTNGALQLIEHEPSGLASFATGLVAR
jgi:6-phosphogluconolactonase